MISVALVSTDRDYARELRSQLLGWGYRPWIAEPQKTFVDQVRDKGGDIVLLDLAAAPADCGSIVKSIKSNREFKHIPIVALVSSAEFLDFDFTMGFEEFMERHAGNDELNARIRFLMWRLSKVDSKDVIKVGVLSMSLASYSVTVAGESLDLTYKEFELLRFLLTHRGRVFSRDALLRHVWGDEYLGGTRTVDVHIRRLRAKVGPQFDELIQTVRNVGYKMKDDYKS